MRPVACGSERVKLGPEPIKDKQQPVQELSDVDREKRSRRSMDLIERSRQEQRLPLLDG